MSEVREFADTIKELGDKIVGMTLKEAKELSDYLEEVHGIKAASGGAMMIAAPAGGAGGDGGEKPEEKTEFDVVLDSFGANKIEIIKIVRAATGASLGDAKTMVETAGSKIKTGIPKEEAEKLKKELEEKGATVSIK